LVANSYYLHKAAQDGYRGYLLSYASHSLKDVYNVHDLDLQKVAKALGLTVPPRINLNLSIATKRNIPRYKKSRKRKSSTTDFNPNKKKKNQR